MAEYIELLRFDCPKCGRKFEETVARLADDPNITCPDCGKVFHTGFYPNQPPEDR